MIRYASQTAVITTFRVLEAIWLFYGGCVVLFSRRSEPCLLTLLDAQDPGLYRAI